MWQTSLSFLFIHSFTSVKALHKERENKCSTRPEFLNLRTIDVLDEITYCCGGLSLALQEGGQAPWSLLTRCQEPLHPPKGVSKHCQMSPVGQNHSWEPLSYAESSVFHHYCHSLLNSTVLFNKEGLNYKKIHFLLWDACKLPITTFFLK